MPQRDEAVIKEIGQAIHEVKNSRILVFCPSICFWQLILAHFGGLIWPTLGRSRLGEAFVLPSRKNKDRRRRCGNVGIPLLFAGIPKAVGRVGGTVKYYV
jgi:hypothetical protein